jgi:hypothetical protein
LRSEPFSGIVPPVALCAKEAVLIVTIVPTGTSTNIAKKRVHLKCSLAEGHAGRHQDTVQNESWEPGKTTVLRSEDEEAP